MPNLKSAMEPILIKQDRAQAWNQFVIGSDFSHIFQSFEWGEFKSGFGWRPVRIAIQEEGKTRAALQILVRKIPLTGRNLFYIPRGPILDYEDERILDFVLNFINEYSRENGAVIVKISPDISVQARDVRLLLERNGFHPSRIQLQHKCTFRIDLSADLEDILAGMESRTRYAIRKAERDGVEIIDDCDIAQFFELYSEAGRGGRFHRKSEAYFQKIQDFLVPKGLARIFVARHRGEPVAGAVIFAFGGKSWYMYGATSLKHRSINSGHLLHWRIIRWAKESNLRWYDLQGIPERATKSHPRWGIYLFKRGFGGKRCDLIGEYDLVWSKPFFWAWRLYSKRLG